MRKGLMTGVIGMLGLAAPPGLVAGMSSAASTVVPSVSTSVANVSAVGGTLMPGIVHVPLLGKHVLSLGSGLLRTTNVQSANWGGYADINDTYQTLSTSWVQPAADCSPVHGGFLGLFGTHTAYSSFWVGLDGYTSTTVEQTGTDTDCTSSGAPSYYAWYEMYPASSVQLSTTQYPVSPGDTMTAMVMTDGGGGTFHLGLKNVTKNWTFTIAEPGGGFARSSAEFVAEAPSQCTLIFCSELPLANFGTVTFNNAFVANNHGTSGNIGTFPNAAMTMVSNGQLLATPGPLTNGGSSFSVQWNS